MKTSAMAVVAFTSFMLIALTIMASMNLPFNWIFYLTVFGQGFVMYMVYRVLTDTYVTSKTFDDFYEDNPIAQENEKFR
ncbi:MAG: hypothetical protein ED555_02355 [Allomuricauda sp.]|nr:MAG: hypothetical protein ED555_02355 [Allomuricauda sp.]